MSDVYSAFTWGFFFGMVATVALLATALTRGPSSTPSADAGCSSAEMGR
jgi:hypothetical protein